MHSTFWLIMLVSRLLWHILAVINALNLLHNLFLKLHWKTKEKFLDLDFSMEKKLLQLILLWILGKWKYLALLLESVFYRPFFIKCTINIRNIKLNQYTRPFLHCSSETENCFWETFLKSLFVFLDIWVFLRYFTNVFY